jgi:hypothetical protein
MSAEQVQNELYFKTICGGLGIECSPVMEYWDGIISIFPQQTRFAFVEGFEWAAKTGKEPNFKNMSADMPRIKQQKFADMVFVDALLDQSDRHSGNFKLLVNPNNTPLDLAPLYDNDQILKDGSYGYSLFKWDTDVEELWEDILPKVQRDFPDRINELLQRASRMKLERLDFVKKVLNI